MKNLWIFGDSFSVPSEAIFKHWVDWQWCVQLSEAMNLTLKCKGEFGVSNDWILTQFNMHMQDYQAGDVVIVQTTQANRYWYFEKKPFVSNPFGMRDNMVERGILTAKESEAMQSYIKHIHSDTKDNLRQQSYYAYLNTMRWVLGHNQITMYILPGFDQPSQFPIAVPGGDIIGCMQHVSKNEFISHDHGEAWYAQDSLPDQRLNHMCRDNHDIFVDKFIKHMDGESLDFLQGWRREFLSIETQQADQLAPSTITANI